MIKIIQLIIGILIFSALISVISEGIKKQEKLECRKWQEWEELYPHFTASGSMREQCKKYNTELEKRWEPKVKEINSDSSTLLELTNFSRVENGTHQLKFNDKLSEAAKAKAEDMFEHNYFEHNSPTGITPWDWINGAGYSYQHAGENIAIDFKSIENAHKALMESPLHKENIISPKYDEIGIAIVKGEFDNEQTIIIVEMFGKLKGGGKNDNNNFRTRD